MLVGKRTTSVITPCCSRVVIDPWEECCLLRDSRLPFPVVFVILFEVFCDEASCSTNTMKKKTNKCAIWSLKTTLKAKMTPIQDSSSSSESDSDYFWQRWWIVVSRVDASCGSVVCPFKSCQIKSG